MTLFLMLGIVPQLMLAQQGYAVLSPDETTLTFKYGTPTGTNYDTDNSAGMGLCPQQNYHRYL